MVAQEKNDQLDQQIKSNTHHSEKLCVFKEQ